MLQISLVILRYDLAWTLQSATVYVFLYCLLEIKLQAGIFLLKFCYVLFQSAKDKSSENCTMVDFLVLILASIW